MSDDTRRPEDDDKTPINPPTGENDVAGADWLISQLAAAPTGQFDTRQAPRGDSGSPADGSRAGDNPVLAWWREKLVAADALVNPEPRPEHSVEDVEDVTDVEGVEEVEADKTDTRRDSVAPVDNVEDSGPVLPEPAQFEPRRAEKTEREFPLEPEPAFTPAPAWTPMVPGDVDNDDFSFDREPENDFDDEAETGLIPTVEPALFTPRSARENLVDESDEFDESNGSDETGTPAEKAHPVIPVPAFSPAPHPDSEPDAAPDTDVQQDLQNETPYETEDLDNFSWKLTANDQLDPRVHSGDAADTVAPALADSAGSGSHSEDAEKKLPTLRRPRFDAEQETSPVEPVILPAPTGPRKRTTYTSPAPGIEPAVPTVAPSPVKPARRPLRPARPAATRAPRPVILAAIGVVAILVLGGLFFLGSRLPGLLAGPAATPTASPSPTATPTPTAPAAPVGPAAVGEQEWTALGGGECLDPYSTPWSETFTVVDCAEPHAAQMVVTGPVAEDPAAEYPGEDEILERIYLWCSAPGVLDQDAASEYSDLQVQGSYPVSEEQWADGQRNYYCFIDRSSGEPLSGSVAAAQG